MGTKKQSTGINWEALQVRTDEFLSDAQSELTFSNIERTVVQFQRARVHRRMLCQLVDVIEKKDFRRFMEMVVLSSQAIAIFQSVITAYAGANGDGLVFNAETGDLHGLVIADFREDA